MRILLLVQALSIGGLPNYVLDLARALAQAGDSVAVAHGDSDVPSHLDVTGVQLLRLPDGNPATAARCMREWQPDLVHVHLCSDPVLLEALRQLELPLLRSFHDYTSLCLRRGRRRWPGDRCQRALGPGCLLQGCGVGRPLPGSFWPTWRNLPAKLAERQTYRSYDMAVVGTDYMRRVLLTNGFAPQRVHRVPYFSRFDAQARGDAPLARKTPGVPGIDRPMQLLFVGQAVAGKGLRVLVRAVAGLDPGQRWQLTTVAAGPEFGPAQALARRLGVDGRIRFGGWVQPGELDRVYRQADLLVLPSVWDDPGPLVGLEAMAVGTPVLGFPVGGIPDYTHDGSTGLLATEVSVKALTASLARALAAGSLLEHMGETARALIAREHGRDRHVATLRDLYRGSMQPQARPRSRAMVAA